MTQRFFAITNNHTGHVQWSGPAVDAAEALAALAADVGELAPGDTGTDPRTWLTAHEITDYQHETIKQLSGADRLAMETVTSAPDPMRRSVYVGDGIQIRMNLTQAACPISWREPGDDEWESTPFQVADAGHDLARALQLVSGHLAQSE